PAPRIAAWDALLRARAIENQCYVVAVNRVGEDGRGLQYLGHSAIYDPLGEAFIEPWEGEGVKQAVIDLDRVRDVRSDFPFAADSDPFTLD
ncbi:MAG: nitrilase-related carbon-nitrogen hydrolase, partial [Pseudomonadota bacterium]